MSEAAVRAYAEAKRFGAATVERWLGHAETDRAALLALAERLRLGENQFRDLLDQLEDIAARQQSSPAAVLASAPVHAVLERGLGRNEAINALKVALRRLRYPQLSAVEASLAALAKQLRLPAGAGLEFPENLEGSQVTITLRAGSPAELRARAASLVAAVARDEVDEMFRLLEGRW